MAIPTTAIPFVRSFSSVMSAAAALATAMLPAIMPETRRVTTTTQNWAAKIQRRYERAFPARVMVRMRRRPRRSDSAPQTGEKMN